MKTYNTLSEAVNDLINLGYTEDFKLKPHCLECWSSSLELNPKIFGLMNSIGLKECSTR